MQMQTVSGKFRGMQIKQLGSFSPILSKYFLQMLLYSFIPLQYSTEEYCLQILLCIQSVLWTPVNHRMVWVGKDLKDHLVPPPCHGQGHLPLAQVAQSPVQPGLEPFQGGGSHSFSGQPVPVSHHPHREELLPYI